MQVLTFLNSILINPLPSQWPSPFSHPLPSQWPSPFSHPLPSQWPSPFSHPLPSQWPSPFSHQLPSQWPSPLSLIVGTPSFLLLALSFFVCAVLYPLGPGLVLVLLVRADLACRHADGFPTQGLDEWGWLSANRTKHP